MPSKTIPYGQRLAPQVVDEIAQHTPDRTYAILPKTDKLDGGFEDLTFEQYANAVNKLAWWLVKELGTVEDDADFPTLAYIGPNDLRYALLCYAAIKAHRKTLVPLPYNSAEAQVRILDLTECKTLIAPKSHRHLWTAPMSERPRCKLFEIPDLDDLIKGQAVLHFPYTKTYEQAKDDPVFIIHTSGTTGLPKPLVWRHALVNATDKAHEISLSSPPDQRLAPQSLMANETVLNPLPQSWGAGLFFAGWSPVYNNAITALLPTDAPQPMTADYIDAVHVALKGQITCGAYVPDTLRQLARKQEYLDHMKCLKTVMFVGAPLEQDIGDKFMAFTRIQPGIGSTDIGIYTTLVNPDPADWNITRFHPTYGGFELEHFADDLYELVLHKTDKLGNEAPAFTLGPNIGQTKLHTKDLWRQVPGRKGYYQTAGRSDDFTKLQSMTKFNAVVIETAINRSLLIKTTLVGGDNRDHTFVIIEPTTEARDEFGEDNASFVDALWPTVEDANKHITEEARLEKRFVIVADKDKPIGRTAKQTVERRKTLDLYANSIEALFER